MNPSDPAWRARVAEIFGQAPFIRSLGITLDDCGPGWCETSLVVRPDLLQQDGVVHAGVQATLADHTAGAAAGTLMPAEQVVLSVEYKVQMLRPCTGERLRCRAEVLRPGRTVSAVEASVWAVQDGMERLTAKLTATMIYTAAPIPQDRR